MASNNSLQKAQAQGLALPQNPVTALFQQFDPNRYNVLAPITHMPILPIGTRIAVTEVRVNPDTTAKEVFAIASGALMLGKTVLDRIAGAAGISWLEERRVDDHKHPHYVEVMVRGRITDFDGTSRELTGTKAIDLRSDAGHDIPGKDLEEIIAKAKKGKRDPAQQVMEARKFIVEMAASKAKNRAIASALGIKRSYSREELVRPFIIPKLVLDSNNPIAQQVVMAQMCGAVGALFGAQNKVIDARLENAAPAAIPRQAGDEEGAELAPAAPSSDFDGPPPMGDHDPVTGEVVRAPMPSVDEIKRRTGAAYAAAKKVNANFTGSAWTSLVKTNTGKAGYEGLTWGDLDAIDAAVDAYVANFDGGAQ